MDGSKLREEQGLISKDTQSHMVPSLYLCLTLFAYESIGQRYRNGIM